MPSCFVDGKPQLAISLDDRGFIYGHGVFETMRCADADVPLWHYHRQRLLEGAEKLCIGVNVEQLENYREQALAAFPREGMLKLILTAGAGPRGYRNQRGEASYIFQYLPLRPASSVDQFSLCLQLCEYRLPHNRRLAGIKHLNRLDQVMAAAELDDGFDGLLMDVDGYIIEGLSSNLFLYDGRRWLTPDLQLCGVAGVMRRLLCEEILPALSHSVTVAQLDLGSLLKAEEVFVCNAITGPRAVLALRDQAHWLPGLETRKIIDHLRRAYPCFDS